MMKHRFFLCVLLLACGHRQPLPGATVNPDDYFSAGIEHRHEAQVYADDLQTRGAVILGRQDTDTTSAVYFRIDNSERVALFTRAGMERAYVPVALGTAATDPRTPTAYALDAPLDADHDGTLDIVVRATLAVDAGRLRHCLVPLPIDAVGHVIDLQLEPSGLHGPDLCIERIEWPRWMGVWQPPCEAQAITIEGVLEAHEVHVSEPSLNALDTLVTGAASNACQRAYAAEAQGRCAELPAHLVAAVRMTLRSHGVAQALPCVALEEVPATRVDSSY